jgi:hypothetical protein
VTMTSPTPHPQIQNPKKQITNQLRLQGMTMLSPCDVSAMVIRKSAGCLFAMGSSP